MSPSTRSQAYAGLGVVPLVIAGRLFVQKGSEPTPMLAERIICCLPPIYMKEFYIA